jgi:hypothetical protein
MFISVLHQPKGEKSFAAREISKKGFDFYKIKKNM